MDETISGEVGLTYRVTTDQSLQDFNGCLAALWLVITKTNKTTITF